METHSGQDEVVYAVEPALSVREFEAVLRASTLGDRRPVDRPDVLQQMLRGADIIVTARLAGPGGRLVGVSRAITDFGYCTYLSDLAVDQAFQRRGIGKELIRRTHVEGGLHTSLILLAAPKARTYYPAIGMTGHDSCWLFPKGELPARVTVRNKGTSPPQQG